MSDNTNMHRAKDAKLDEFYTQLEDIEKEMAWYRGRFKGMVVYCNCDDPYESNFFRYFAMNFRFLGLKGLMATCYNGSPIAGRQLTLDGCEVVGGRCRQAYKVVLTEDDMPEDIHTMEDVKALLERPGVVTVLKGNGDFRSKESVELLDRADIVVTNPPFSCHSEDTEVLTDSGWRLFKDVDAGRDRVLSMDIRTKEMSYAGITDVLVQDYCGPMYHFESRYMDQLVTPNHRMISNRRGRDAEFRLAEDIKDGHDRLDMCGYTYLADCDREVFELEGCVQREQNSRKPVFVPTRTIPMDDWLEFFGFWLADGCVRRGNNSQGNPRYVVSIKQNRANEGYVLDIFRRIGFECKVYRNESGNDNYEVYSKQLWNELCKYGGSCEKYIPAEIKNLPPERLRHLLKGYRTGDGQYGLSDCRMDSVSSRLMDDIIEVFLKVEGRILHRNVRRMEYKGEPYEIYSASYTPGSTHGAKYHHTVEHYQGRIYCFTLDRNNTMLVRRNGKPTWSGNCFRDYVSQLMEHDKKFIIMGNLNAITYKEVFKYIMADRLWLGASIHSGGVDFRMPDDIDLSSRNVKIKDGARYLNLGNIRWYTNIDHAQRHEPIILCKRFNPEDYPYYDNYDAIEVSKVADIPEDYFEEEYTVETEEELKELLASLDARGRRYTVEEM